MKNSLILTVLITTLIAPSNTQAGILGGENVRCQCVDNPHPSPLRTLVGKVALVVKTDNGSFLKKALFPYHDLVEYREAFEDCKGRLEQSPECRPRDG